MKKYLLSVFIFILGFFIGQKYTLDQKKKYNSNLITNCITQPVKNYLEIQASKDTEVLKVVYTNNSECVNFEQFNVKLIKFYNHQVDTIIMKVSETIYPMEEVEISLNEIEFDSVYVLDYDIILLNLNNF